MTTSRYSILEDVELVKRTANESDSISQMLLTLGLGDKSTDYRKIRECAEQIGIELPKWHSRDKMDAIRKSIPNREVFTKDSTYLNRTQIKKRMIRDFMVEPVCDECEIKNEWNGRPLTLTLDHINGVGNDNRIENLRLLCPNCHSQTETFAGRNTSKQKHNDTCADCGEKKKTAKSARCRSCAGSRNANRVDWPEPEEVLNLVKSDGFEATGRILNATGNAVRKFLQRNDLL